MEQRVIITELNIQTITEAQKRLGNRVMIVKFGAEWCGPCKKIHSICQNNFRSLPTNVVCADIDVDECIDVYATLKRRKMLIGIPTLLAFYGDVERDHWYIPDDSVSGGNKQDVQNFFDRCSAKAKTMILPR